MVSTRNSKNQAANTEANANMSLAEDESQPQKQVRANTTASETALALTTKPKAKKAKAEVYTFRSEIIVHDPTIHRPKSPSRRLMPTVTWMSRIAKNMMESTQMALKIKHLSTR